MGRITVLDLNTVNMIAAGEVIERPASVVKELVENSVDAGATRVVVSIEAGGRKLVSVTDNGTGMDGADLQKAFEPHATSKIQRSSDLDCITTLGFRGEALSSIASVARVEAKSRPADSAGGHCIEIDCGGRIAFGPCSSDRGTTVQVRDIFYRLPARQKFLRTDSTEMSHVTEQFKRISLSRLFCNARKAIDMALIHNGRRLYHVPADTDARRRVTELFGEQIGEDLIELSHDRGGISIRAMLGTSRTTRNSSGLQYVFLNGRFIRDRLILHAVRQAYRGIIEHDRFPVVFLFIEMPPQEVDVNVHPTKTEVRFRNSSLVHSQVAATLREKLLDSRLRPAATLPPQAAGTGPGIFETRTSFGAAGSLAAGHANRPFPATPCAAGPVHRKFIQIQDSYIVAATGDGLVIIDQHALHERIIYEQLRERIIDNKLPSQRLLVPQVVDLSEAEAETLAGNADLLERLGIEIEAFGPREWAVRAFPIISVAAGRSRQVDVKPDRFLRDLAGILEKGRNRAVETLLDEIISMAACKAAVKAGKALADQEIEQLLADAGRAGMLTRCPHGRPYILELSTAQLEKQFGRV